MHITALLICLLVCQLASGAGELNDEFENEVRLGWNCRNAAEGISHFDRALKIEPDAAIAYEGRAKKYQSIGKYQDALKDWEKAIELDPQRAILHLKRAELYERLRQLTQAAADLDRAIELEPKNGFCWRDRAMFEMKIGKKDYAIADFPHAIVLEPTYNDFYYRALLYKQKGERLPSFKDLAAAHHTPPSGEIGAQNIATQALKSTEPFRDENGNTYKELDGKFVSKEAVESEYELLKQCEL